MNNYQTTFKICIGYHKPSFLLEGDCFVPIWGGKAVAARQFSKDGPALSPEEYLWMDEHCLGDDTGDNISDQNRTYCEASILYWMWKNYDKLGSPDYIGYLQYRRHWYMRELEGIKPNFFNLIDSDIFTVDHQYSIGLTEGNIRAVLSEYDGIFCTNDNGRVVYDYKRSHHSQKIEYFDLAGEIIKNEWSQYAGAFDKYVHGTWHAWSNCFVMKREDFLEYAPFLFDVLFKVDRTVRPEYVNMTLEQMRVPAYISETLLGVFWTYLKEKGRRIRSLPLVHVKRPFSLTSLLPRCIAPVQESAIPIVLISDSAYLRYTSVLIHSIIATASRDRFYDIIVLDDGSTPPTSRERIEALSSNNISIRFLNAAYYFKKYNIPGFFHRRLNTMPYLKLFIHEILRDYDKAIFLDGDMIVMQDIALLYDRDMEGCLIGAVRDAVMTRCNDSFWEKRRNYISSNAKMQDVTRYFNSGTLLLNLRAMRDTPELLNQFINEARYTKPDRLHHDQDVLNFVLEGRVKYLPCNFNFQLRTILEPTTSAKMADSIKQALLENYDNIVVLHFDGDTKPWRIIRHRHKFHDLWWLHARQIPFYEDLFISAMERWLYRILRDVSALTKNELRLLFYRIITNFTFGEKRVRYTNAMREIRALLDRTRRILK